MGFLAIHRHQSIATGRRNIQADFLSLGLVRHFLKLVFLFFAVLVLQVFSTLKETVAVEGLGNHLHQTPHQFFHILLELGALTSR